jgi:predicted TIM-barrel fold metal-dependent hydrolase
VRNGYRIFDADTHFHPTVESLLPFMDAALRKRTESGEFATREQRIGWAGEEMPAPYRHLLRFEDGGGWAENPPRRLGDAAPDPNAKRHFQTFMGFKTPSTGGADFDVDARVRDMDEEGVDVHLMVPSVPQGHAEPAVDLGLLAAMHRVLDDACGRHPDRLTSLIVTTARDVEGSVEEIKRWAGSKWARGVMVNLPIGKPVDHPDLHPIWAAANEAGLTVVHHSFAAGYPGYRDLWDNPFVGRTASHPWGAMRMVAAFLGAGLMDHYPDLKLAVLESGFGWLPFWMKRMEDQVVYMGYVAEGLKHTMTEYMTGGRFHAAIVLHEGPELVRLVSEIMGEHVLMFGSDYPHAESRFPNSADIVLEWGKQGVGEGLMRKLMWDNAAACYGIS